MFVTIRFTIKKSRFGTKNDTNIENMQQNKTNDCNYC